MGGAVHPHPEKSYWYLLDFQWTGNRWRYRSKETMPGEASVVDETGTRNRDSTCWDQAGCFRGQGNSWNLPCTRWELQSPGGEAKK